MNGESDEGCFRVKGHLSFRPSRLILALLTSKKQEEEKKKKRKQQRGFGFLTPSVSESSSSVLISSRMVHFYVKVHAGSFERVRVCRLMARSL